ncbi:MAG: thiamine pyrophosphate-dependent enzyme, partial [Pseudomonadota bacterium]
MRETRDPIDGLRKVLIDQGIADEAALKAVDKEIKAVVNDAAQFAQESPEPALEELYTDILAEA